MVRVVRPPTSRQGLAPVRLLPFLVLLTLAPWLQAPAGEWQPRRAAARAAATEQGAESRAPLQLLHHLGGAVTAIAVEGHLAYVGMGPRLVVWDVADPARPVRLGVSEPLSGLVEDLLVQDGFAYLSLWGQAGLGIVDVGDPLQPRDLGMNAAEFGQVSAMALLGPLLFVGTSYHDLHAMDLSRPEAPGLLASVDLGGTVHSIAISEDRLFAVVAERAVKVVDIAQPAAMGELAALNFDMRVSDLLLRDNLAVVVLSSGRESEVVLLDVADPAQPRRLGQVMVKGNANDAAWAGSTLLVGTYTESLNGGPRGRVRVVDIASPSLPREVAVMATDSAVVRLAIAGDLAFAVTFGGTLHTFGIEDKDGPHRVGAMPTDDAVRGIAIDGGLAYLAVGKAGLQVFDVSNRHAPRKLSQLSSEAEARDLVVRDKLVYLATSKGLEVIDASLPTEPRLIGRLEVEDKDFKVDLLGNNVLLLGQDHGLSVIDVTRPESPRRVGELRLFWAHGIAVVRDHAFIVHHPPGPGDASYLSAVDLSQPSRPRIVAEIQTHDAAMDIVVKDGLAYVACIYSGLWVADISDPARLREVAHLPLPGIYRVAIEGQTLVAGMIYESGRVMNLALWAIDVSRPEDPVFLGSADLGTSVMALAVDDETAFLGSNFERSSGFQLIIVDVSDPVPPAELSSVVGTPLPEAVAALGSQVLLAGPTGIQLLDPRKPATVPPPLILARQSILGIQAQGSRAYLRLEDHQPKERIEILDMTDPFQPQTLGTFPVGSDTKTWALDGDWAYVVDNLALHVWDLTEPGAAKETAAVAIPPAHFVMSLAVAKGHVYAVSDEGLLVFDVRNPQAPGLVGQLQRDNLDGVDIAIYGNWALIATTGSGDRNLQVVDISRPERPMFVSAAGASESAVAVAVDSGRVVLLTDPFGHQVNLYELDRRGRLRALDSLEFGGRGANMVIVKGQAYVAAGQSGLFVLDLWGDRPLRWKIGLPYLTSAGAQVP